MIAKKFKVKTQIGDQCKCSATKPKGTKARSTFNQDEVKSHQKDLTMFGGDLEDSEFWREG